MPARCAFGAGPACSQPLPRDPAAGWGPGVLWAPPRPLLGGREQMQEESKALILLIDAPPGYSPVPGWFQLSRLAEQEESLLRGDPLCLLSCTCPFLFTY